MRFLGDEEMVLIHSRIEREIGVITGKSVEGKNGSHFVFPPTVSILSQHFFRPPSESEMQSDIIKCSESLSFTLHGVRSNFKTRMGIRSCHGGAGADEIISQKSGQTALHFKSFAS